MSDPGAAGQATARVRSALALARDLAHRPWEPIARDGATRRRFFAIGDPQASAERFFSILDANDLLGGDGRLARDAWLLSIGDHFDYEGDVREVGEEGLAILRWLAEHPPDQVTVLAGNHDLSRVQELALETDESFARARKLALEIRALEKAAARDEAALAERRLAFERDHGRLPPPEVAARDYSSFTEEQRALVVALLVAGRFRLAHAARTREGRPLLLTHASLGTRELEIASVPVERDADAIARALNGWLDRAVRRAKTSWEKDELAPLDLAPLHVFGARGREGGGLLYHRPSNPERPGARPLWEASDLAPRRFDARELPLGLLQACGHTSHRKCLKDLEGWLAPGVGELSRGALRTLRTDGSRVSYDGGLGAVPEREAGLYFLDSSMKFVDPPAYRLLELSAALA